MHDILSQSYCDLYILEKSASAEHLPTYTALAWLKYFFQKYPIDAFSLLRMFPYSAFKQQKTIPHL